MNAHLLFLDLFWQTGTKPHKTNPAQTEGDRYKAKTDMGWAMAKNWGGSAFVLTPLGGRIDLNTWTRWR